jgi:hypothetical protein
MRRSCARMRPHRELGDGDGVLAGAVRDPDPALGSGLDVDGVEPRAPRGRRATVRGAPSRAATKASSATPSARASGVRKSTCRRRRPERAKEHLGRHRGRHLVARRHVEARVNLDEERPERDGLDARLQRTNAPRASSPPSCARRSPVRERVGERRRSGIFRLDPRGGHVLPRRGRRHHAKRHANQVGLRESLATATTPRAGSRSSTRAKARRSPICGSGRERPRLLPAPANEDEPVPRRRWGTRAASRGGGVRSRRRRPGPTPVKNVVMPGVACMSGAHAIAADPGCASRSGGPALVERARSGGHSPTVTSPSTRERTK